MPFWSLVQPNTLRLVLLGASAFMLYGAGRLIMGSIPARADRPGVRALLGAAVVLMIAGVAVVMGRPNIGLHLPIASAAAAMTFGLGSVILGRSSHSSLRGGEAIGNSSWALLAPAVAITLFAGLGGRFDLAPIAALIAFGVVAILAWREPEATAEASLRSDQAETDPVLTTKPRGSATLVAVWLWLAGLVLAGLAGVLVMLGLPALETTGIPSDPLAVVFLLSPAIVVPLFFELLPPCRSIAYAGSVSVLVKFAIINVCFILPIAAVLQADMGVLRELWQSRTIAASSQPTAASTTQPTQPATSRPAATPVTADAAKVLFPSLPAVAMRADLLVLAGALLLILPMAAGWQRPGRLEAVSLIACYLLALSLVMASMVLWRR